MLGRVSRNITAKDEVMYVQTLTFQLEGVSEAEYAGLCNGLAPTFAEVPGLLSKVWLGNSSTGTHGGVYFWSDRRAMEDFARTDLFNSVATHPNLVNIRSIDCGVLEEPTKVTRGFLVAP